MKRLLSGLAIAFSFLGCDSQIAISGNVIGGPNSSRELMIAADKAREERGFKQFAGTNKDDPALTPPAPRQSVSVTVYDADAFNDYLRQHAESLDTIIKDSTDKFGLDPAKTLAALTADMRPTATTATDSDGNFALTLPRKGCWVFVTNSGISLQTVAPGETVILQDGSVFSGDSLKIALAQIKAANR